MIAVIPPGEPEVFDKIVRQPGNRWLSKHGDGRPPAYWTKVREALAEGFHDRCAYSAQQLNTPGTVDHFISIDEDRDKAYEWSNYRYAASWINSCKLSVRSTELLDPFEVQAPNAPSPAFWCKWRFRIVRGAQDAEKSGRAGRGRSATIAG